MKRTTTWVFGSPVRPHSCLSRTVYGQLFGRAVGAQWTPLPAAQEGQPKSLSGKAHGGVGRLRRRCRFPERVGELCVLLLIVLCISLKVDAVALSGRQTQPATTQTNTQRTRPTSAPAPTARPSSREPVAPAPAASLRIVVPVPLPPHEPGACSVAGDNSVPAMVVIEPGRFSMGSPETEPGRDKDEGPVHTVTVPKPFAMGRCELTVAQFRRFVQATGYQTQADKEGCYVWNEANQKGELRKGSTWQNPGFTQTDEHPVVCVSQADAEAYVGWLSRRTGAVYRLPSEAEWEYAARADSSGPTYWDDAGGEQCEYANGADRRAKSVFPSFDAASCDDGYLYTAPVGSYRPNGFGLYDILGNALEWTVDCYHDNYEHAPDDGSAWQDLQGDKCRPVVRGGSWVDGPRNLRSSDRGRFGRVGANDFLGFRLARDL